MSVGTVSIFVNWLIQGNFKEKFSNIKNNKVALSVLAIFAIHLIGLVWTTDFDYAFHDLKIKAPILALTLIFGSQMIFDLNQRKNILLSFVVAVALSVGISLYTYLKLSAGNEPFDMRDISIFISQIRQSLMVVFSIIILIYYSKKGEIKSLFLVIGVVLFGGYLLFSGSLTGVVLIAFFLITAPFWIHGFKVKSVLFSCLTLLIIGGAFTYFSANSYAYYFTPKEVEKKEKTSLGNLYAHNLSLNQLENGYYIGVNLAEQELKEGWEKRSDSSYLSVSAALIRYLTSEGLSKDAEALNKISAEGINDIEQKKTSSRDLNALSKRLDEFYFEIAILINKQNPSHNSIAQRVFAWNIGSEIIQKNKLIGVGTGDVKTTFEKEYSESSFTFSKKIRAHNQYLTFFIAFGIIGGIVCLCLILFPIKVFWKEILALAFYTIILLSFLTEDTLETQAGVLFYSFFLGLFINSSFVSKAKA